MRQYVRMVSVASAFSRGFDCYFSLPHMLNHITAVQEDTLE